MVKALHAYVRPCKRTRKSLTWLQKSSKTNWRLWVFLHQCSRALFYCLCATSGRIIAGVKSGTPAARLSGPTKYVPCYPLCVCPPLGGRFMWYGAWCSPG